MTVGQAPLSAPLEVGFDYTRSLGPLLSEFATALAGRRLLGVRGSDGRVHVPPVEYDPVTAAPLSELVEVATAGTVRTWSWQAQPLAGQPLPHPFGWALIHLDGAGTAMLHAVDAGTPDRMRTGMRVRVRWSDTPGNGIRDIACFEPLDAPQAAVPAGPPAEPVTMITAPVHLTVLHTVSPGEDVHLRGLAEGRLIGQRCPVCHKVYVPSRGACPTCGVFTGENVELPDRGTVTTFCVVNVPFLGQRITPPYVAAYILLDGADIAFLHLVLGCRPDEVRMGMRVAAVWRPRAEWGTTTRNIDHFRPTGEPDAPYESYANHL
ncbi:Zn-ribbon domain-containing OB-fold protein [Actinophytocola sp.]|uniref:Zn-ribbon domain-containing OB-fold protein n=1 Tax=Actinophytocola sp. TaxID=1872138 RepID=UPI002D7E3C2C|nr:OB-fold domain-containing protein [Actinophytocola sp.]HET9142587.1 OB-fold domain-containing protein [Actinophytocola sp.]